MPRFKSQKYYNKRGRYIHKKRRYRPSPWRSIRRRLYRLSRQMNVEYKRHYDQYTANTIGTSATIQNVNIIDQGTVVTQRIGNQVKIISHYINSLFTINASATNTQIRFMVVLDKQVNGATFAIGDLLRDTSATDILVSSMDIDNGKRFKILYNKLFLLSPEFPSKQIKYFKKHSLKIKYDGNTSSVADQTTNGLYIVFFSNESTNQPAITLSSCIRYVDN